MAKGKGDEQPGEITAGEAVKVTQGVPDMTVIVNPGVTMRHEDVEYTEGMELTIPGPVAESYAFLGACQIT